jgi:hypothetical protein
MAENTIPNIISDSRFLDVVDSLDTLDILSCSLVELGVLLNSKLPKQIRISETQWKDIVYDNVSADIKVMDNYLEIRQALAMKKIGAKRELLNTITTEAKSFTKQKGALDAYRIRFQPVSDEDSNSGKIPVRGGGIFLIPIPPTQLASPPDAHQASLDAEAFYTNYIEINAIPTPNRVND